MSPSAIVLMFGLLQIVAIALALVLSEKGRKIENAGRALLGSAFCWAVLAIFLVVDSKTTGMNPLELDSLLKILCASAASGALSYGLHAWKAHRSGTT